MTPSVIYVMNWESEVLLVLDKSSLMASLLTLYLVRSHNCHVVVVVISRGRIECIPAVLHVGDSSTLKQFTGGLASQCNKEELALLLQHIQVFECRNNAGLCL